MTTQKFITEEPQTSIRHSHYGWNGETYVKIKGYCYMITTSKGYGGKVSSTARKVNDAGTSGGMRAVSFSVFGGEEWALITEEARATESKITEIHTKAIEKFLAMETELPAKEEAYEIKPGQVIISVGYGLSEGRDCVVYKVDEDNYYFVNKDTLELGADQLHHLSNISKRFGIGRYYEEGDMMDVDTVNNLVLDAIDKRKSDEAEAPAKAAAAKAESEAAIAALKAEYPYLNEKTDRSGGVFVAKNIRIELKRHFPEISFGVTSSYSSVNVTWTDGPSTRKVKAIIDKYEDHVTDISGDFRDYDPSLFNRVFGGCNYVFENRDISKETLQTLTEWAQKHRPERVNREVNELFADNDIPAVPWHITRAEDEHGYHIEALEPVAVPEAVAAATPSPVMVGKASVSFNAEKNGIEIKFPAKPSDETLNALKSVGFRWSRFGGVWWIKRTPELQGRIESLLKAL